MSGHARFGSVAVALAVFSVAGAARAEFADFYARQDDVGEQKVPRFGTSHLLVIPVEIRGEQFPALDREKLVSFFETESDVEFRFRSYFKTASNERYTPDVTVAPTMVFSGCPAGLDADCRITGGSINAYQDAARGILREVFGRADDGCFAAPGTCVASTAIDFSQYDRNGIFGRPDGYVDGVIIVTNLPEFRLALPIGALNGADDGDLAGGHGGDFVLDDTKVPSVALCGDQHGKPGTRTEYACVQTFGQLLGLAPLYQENLYQPAHPHDVYAGLEGSLMGNWSYDSSAPMPDAESRYRLQWADANVVSGKQTLTLAPAAAGGRIVKLGLQAEGRREYYLVEARGPFGPYDRNIVRSSDGAPVYGLAVYHVDWTKGPSGDPGTFIKQILTCLDCDPWHPFLMNVQADRRFEIQQNKPFRPEEDLFLAGSAFVPAQENGPFSEQNQSWGSNWYDGTPSGIRIENVRVDADTGFITADFTAPVAADLCADLSCGPGQSCVAGNCRPPEERPEPVPTKKPVPPPAPKADTGWGCASTSPAAGLLAVALAMLLARKSKRIA